MSTAVVVYLVVVIAALGIVAMIIYLRSANSDVQRTLDEVMMVGTFHRDALARNLEPNDDYTDEASVLAHMIKHFQVTIDDWGPVFEDQRYHWTVYDKRSDRVQFMRPVKDWSDVVGVGFPYMIGAAATAEQAHEEAILWMAEHPTMTWREDLS
jgi:hypothetical protein